MTLYAYDGAAPFSLTAAKAHGAIAITGYLVGKPGGFDPCDKPRVDQIRAMGMGFSPNWERMADYFLTQSVAACRTAGVEALNACRALGVPDDGTVRCSFSIDTQVPGNRFAEMGDKLVAANQGMGGAYQTMLYGQSDLIDWLCAQGYLTGKHWLMASTWGEPYNATSPNVCAIQSHDPAGNWLDTPVTGTDINTVTDPHALGAWWPDGSPYGGDDMPLSADDIQKIETAIWGHTFQFTMGSKQVQGSLELLGAIRDLAGDTNNKAHLTNQAVTGEQSQLAQVLAQVNTNEKSLTKLTALVTELQAAGGGGMTIDQIAASLAIAKKEQ